MEHKPKYHFVPEKNWMNDPNGPIFHEGIHHLFYQYNPTDWHWGNLHWGHATSRDLVHWTHQPIALYPAVERGENHCYSGSSYIHDGRIELIYTSVGAGERNQIYGSEQWVAVTEDNLTWKQIPQNPVLRREDNGGKNLTQWRDPFYFHYKGCTYLLIAGITDGKRGATHIYKTDDMRHFTYLNEFYCTSTPNELMECPNVAVFGDKLLFLYSVWNQREIRYLIGTMNEEYQFLPETDGRIDYGEFFASQISFDDKGRTLMWGWLREMPRNLLYTDGEWAGVQAFPRVISLNERNQLQIKRLPELDMLRKEEEHGTLENFSGTYRFQINSNTAEVCAEVKTEDPFGIRVLASEDGSEYTDIIIEPHKGIMKAFLRNSSKLEEVDKNMLSGSFRKRDDGIVAIDILIDCSVIEAFINENGCISPRVYPTLTGGGISLWTEGRIEWAKLSAYRMEL